MADSPISATPYEVLGVPPTASTDELRRAYRRLLRDTHPDTGGSPEDFNAVQRAWERVGTPESRASYDRAQPSQQHAPRPQPARRSKDSRPLARSYGHPGGWRRERYLALIKEWVGRGVTIDDPYDSVLISSAPRDVRHLLADAVAEEETARSVAELGIAYTVWHDVATDAAGGGPEQKIDHIVLGPTGLFALLSEDWGAPVSARRGEVVGTGLAVGERPMSQLERRAKSISKAARVRFTALAIVVPDDAIDQSLLLVGQSRGAAHLLVQRSYLPGLLRNGLADSAKAGGTEIFDIRTRLHAAIRFV